MIKENYPLTWDFHHNTSRWQNIIPFGFSEDKLNLTPIKENLSSELIQLGSFEIPILNIADLIKNRFSCRLFKKESISLKEISILLNVGYGIDKIIEVDEIETITRNVPSGGGLYPLEFYIIALNVEGLEKGIYHFIINPHSLEKINCIDINENYLSNLFINQPYITNASAIIVSTSIVERNMYKYGDRGYRYILFEAGHAFQNINLVAEGLNLGTLNIGGFFDSELATLLEIDIENELPLYAMAIGMKGDAINLRIP